MFLDGQQALGVAPQLDLGEREGGGEGGGESEEEVAGERVPWPAVFLMKAPGCAPMLCNALLACANPLKPTAFVFTA
jgi:hypothetical protein